jgi:hypothetical protein
MISSGRRMARVEPKDFLRVVSLGTEKTYSIPEIPRAAGCSLMYTTDPRGKY